MKIISTALCLAFLTVAAAWGAPGAPQACAAGAQQPDFLLPEPGETTQAAEWCHVWCPSPPYAMNWYIACEALSCGSTSMYCAGGYSLSCEKCQDAYMYGGPQCLY